MLSKLRDILGNLPSLGTWPPIANRLEANACSGRHLSEHREDYRIAFWAAATTGDSKYVTQCLEDALVDVNAIDQAGMTALIHAVRAGQINTTSLLLQCGRVDVNVDDAAGRSALHYAIVNRNCLLTTWLLTRVTDEYIINKALMTTFAQFCQSQLNPDESMRIQAYQLYEEMISRLLHHGANPSLGGLQEAAQNYPRIQALLNAAGRIHSAEPGQEAAEVQVGASFRDTRLAAL